MHARLVLLTRAMELWEVMMKWTKDCCGGMSYTQDQSCAESRREANCRNPTSAHFDEFNRNKKEDLQKLTPPRSSPTERVSEPTLLHRMEHSKRITIGVTGNGLSLSKRTFRSTTDRLLLRCNRSTNIVLCFTLLSSGGVLTIILNLSYISCSTLVFQKLMQNQRLGMQKTITIYQ